jgi:hypothetical protein
MLDFEQYEKIIYYKNVIKNTKTLVDSIEYTDSLVDENSALSKWEDWDVSDNSYTFGKKKSSFLNKYSTSSLDVKFILDSIINPIQEASLDYSKMFNIDIGSLMPISISKYTEGKEMGYHVDSYGDERSPVISVVCYLNDDYTGGEIHFKDQDVKIKPEAGSILIFPSVSPYYHSSLAIKSGIKYISPGFWYKDVVK